MEALALSADRLVDMLQTMLLIRAFEEKAEELFGLGKVHGTMHLSIGQEAVAAGVCAALRPDDYILSTHRGHGHCLAKGVLGLSSPAGLSEAGGRGAPPGEDARRGETGVPLMERSRHHIRRMMAEFLGRETGYCRGRGGSMHIADVDSGNLGANGIVAGGLPLATGVGLSIQMRRSRQVCVAFFGDGAANEGAFHESLNLSAIWRLPVVWVCENNQYAMSMPVRASMSVEGISQRACAYGIPGKTVDGMDPLAVYQAAAEAVARARAGEGPTLVEYVTYRYRGHSKSDRQRYRTRAEVDAWRRQDPLTRFRARLVGDGAVTPEAAERMEAEARATIEEALRFAESSPEPDPEGLLEGVYA